MERAEELGEPAWEEWGWTTTPEARALQRTLESMGIVESGRMVGAPAGLLHDIDAGIGATMEPRGREDAVRMEIRIRRGLKNYVPPPEYRAPEPPTGDDGRFHEWDKCLAVKCNYGVQSALLR